MIDVGGTIQIGGRREERRSGMIKSIVSKP
jgi:hypothetical protein